MNSFAGILLLFATFAFCQCVLSQEENVQLLRPRSADMRAIRHCSNPPYVSCGVCSTKPWNNVRHLGNKTQNPRVVMSNNKKDLRVYDPGNVVYYAAKNYSYSLLGNISVQCLTNGSWSAPPTCDFFCTTLPPVVNATCQRATENGGRYRTKEKTTCQCNSGLVRKTGFLRPTCKKGERWSTALICRPPITPTSPDTVCNALPSIFHGTCNSVAQGQTSWKLGDEIECQCTSGYASYQDANGNDAIRRMSLGTSTRRSGSNNSRALSSSNVRSVTVKRAQCNGSNRWLSLLNCEAITTTTPTVLCQKPPAVANAGCDGCEASETETSIFHPGDSIVFACRDGFRMEGNPVLKCLVTGAWAKPPTCVKTTAAKLGCRGLPDIPLGSCDIDEEDDNEDESGIIVGRGETVTCQCDDDEDNAVLVGPSVVTCQRDDTWSQVPKCVQNTTSCSLSTLGTPAHGFCRSAKNNGAVVFVSGEQAVCNCDPGFYALQGAPGQITCTKGTWTNSKPTCVPTTSASFCTLPDISFGYCDGPDDTGQDKFTLGQAVTCQCNTGYELSTESTVKCVASPGNATLLQWSPTPRCVPQTTTLRPYDCPYPPHVTCDNMNDKGGASAGDTLTGCRCERGYLSKNSTSSSGSVTMTCRVNSSGTYYRWSDTLACVAEVKGGWYNDPVCGIRNGNDRMSKQNFTRLLATANSYSNKSSNRIVNGKNAIENEFPWQVRVETEGFLCGGSLINNQWIITAAHCIDPDDIGSAMSTIFLGSQSLDFALSSEIIMDSSFMTQHPEYDRDLHYNDIALIKLLFPIDFTSSISPICLLNSDCTGEADPGAMCVISGWGTMEEDGGSAASILQKAQVPAVSKATCQEAYKNKGYEDIITDGMRCAGFVEGGIDTCQGDSGGPLVCHRKDDLSEGAYYLHGATSYGYGCARPGLYGIYTSPCHYMDWIIETINNSEDYAYEYESSIDRHGRRRSTTPRRVRAGTRRRTTRKGGSAAGTSTVRKNLASHTPRNVKAGTSSTNGRRLATLGRNRSIRPFGMRTGIPIRRH